MSKKFHKDSEWVSKSLNDSGLSKKEYAEKIGVTRATLDNWIKQGGVSYKNYLSIVDKIEEEAPVYEARRVDESLFKKIPLIDIYAYGSYLDRYDDKEWNDSQRYIPAIVSNDGNYKWFEIRGDSMEDNNNIDSMPEGSYFLGRELYKEHWINIRYKQYPFWIIVHKQKGILCKQITKQVDNIITCHSLNPTVKDFKIDLNEVAQLWYRKKRLI